MDARAVALYGEVAFVADGASGLKVVDISSPVQPTRVGSVSTQYACDLAVHQGYLYLADGQGGLKIFELSGSASGPAQLMQRTGLADVDVRALAAEGNRLYLAVAGEGLIIMDVSEADRPVELGRFAAGEILDLEVGGAFVYLAVRGEGLIVVDVSDPIRPRHFADLPDKTISGVSVQGQYAYLAGASGLRIVHILIQGRSVPVSDADTGGKAYGLTVSGDMAYVAGHDRGVHCVDVCDPFRVDEGSAVGSWPEDYAMGIEVEGSVAYVANGRRGLSIVDLSALWDDDPATQPSRIGSYFTGGTAHKALLRAGRLYVADGREGLKILDVTVANNPVEIASFPGDDVRDVALVSDYGLVADQGRGLVLLDLTDPVGPIRLTTLDVPGVRQIAVQDHLAAAAGQDGVQLFDLSDPRNPQWFGSFGSGYVESICIDGTYLYIAEGHRGLQVVDIRSFDSPVRVSACADVYAVAVAAAGGYALVADSRRLHVVEVLVPDWLRRSSLHR
jgi:hypothetical protein